MIHKIEYEVDINDEGRPYIKLPETFNDTPENKFFVLELTRYLLTSLINKRESQLDEDTVNKILISNGLISIISDEVASILRNQMEAIGELYFSMKNEYHIKVKTIEERNKLNYNGIIYDNKIYKRIEGLKVFVENENKTYELINGIDNENWK
jgi:hypothetical protein